MPSKCSIYKQTGHNKLSCPENNTLEITIPRMCPICYVNITKKKGFVKTECGHTFCYKCFIKWTYNNVTCPLCRKVIKKPNKDQFSVLNLTRFSAALSFKDRGKLYSSDLAFILKEHQVGKLVSDKYRENWFLSHKGDRKNIPLIFFKFSSLIFSRFKIFNTAITPSLHATMSIDSSSFNVS